MPLSYKLYCGNFSPSAFDVYRAGSAILTVSVKVETISGIWIYVRHCANRSYGCSTTGFPSAGRVKCIKTISSIYILFGGGGGCVIFVTFPLQV